MYSFQVTTRRHTEIVSRQFIGTQLLLCVVGWGWGAGGKKNYVVSVFCVLRVVVSVSVREREIVCDSVFRPTGED